MPPRKLTPEEVAKLILLPLGKKHPIRILNEAMEQGEMPEVSRQDFDWKNQTPGIFYREIEKRSKARFQLYKKQGNTGWPVQRVV